VHIALVWVITRPMGQITSKTVRMGLSFGSKLSLFGWLGHLPVVAKIKRKNEVLRVIRHFKGALGSPNPVSKVNFTSIRAQGAILNSKKFL